MLRGGRGGRFASQALALGGGGGRAAAAGARAPGVGVAGSFPPTPPSSRAAAGASAGAASGGEPAPGPAEPCPEPGAPRGAAPGEEPRRLGRVQCTDTAVARARLHENSLRALLACSTMSAKSAISKEIFAPLDERMLGAVQVKRRTKKKIPFLATGGQGEYLTYICLSVTNKKPTQASITKVKQFEGSTSFVRRSQWMLEQLRQVNGIDPNRDSAEFDLLFENAFDQWVASTASEKCTFFQILHHTCQRYLTDRKPEFINCQSKIMGGNSILHSAADSVTSAVQKASQALNERGERLGRAEEKTEDMKNSAQQFAETAHKLAMKHKC
ncbi:syntaxin-binding protein 6 isoform X1 [Equus quagga]|uniref:syntaxin-binding protein 6 isoform X1 n=1 Tax=Equus quagga TaxID=89248 RepID=UPI001EE24B2F|nr:syntaxin-binding protein 6 isoform X1 [Equus quagga]